MSIVALDPGLTMGICILEDNGKYETRQLKPMDYPHPHETLYDVLSEINPKTLIYERFDFRAAKNGVVLTGVEFIGVLRLYAQIKCIEEIAISASDGKAFWTDNKLRMLGLYMRGMPHGNDATRIMNTYRMKNDAEWRERIIAELRASII